MPANRLNPLIIGCGYLGRTLGQILIDRQQLAATGVVASEQSYNRLLTMGLDAHILNLDQPLSKRIDPGGRDVYYFAPPPAVDDKDDRIDHFLRLCRTRIPRRIVYISTSGVYGNCHGDWVDESKPIAPATARAKRRAYAEQSLLKFCQQFFCEYMVLRVGGIYGPERLPINRLTNTKVICLDEAPYSNRIHILDLANICQAAMQSQSKNEVINVADGHPTSMTDYFYQIADAAGLPRPECVPMSQAKEVLSSGMFSFVSESRRLSTEKMHALLNVDLQFPTLKLGLEDCFKKLNAK